MYIMNIKHLITVAFFCLALGASAQEKIDYRPNFHGAVRTRWEMETESGESRFQVRYARFTIDGKVAPCLDYFLQTDLCDQGAIKILDAYARVRIVKGLQFQAGQFRMPFGVETFRAPQNYIFANRSFMAKDVCNYRKVGAKVAYTLPVKTPLLLEAGIFNNAAIGNHNTWSKHYAFAGKATLTLDQFKISGGAMSVRPDVTRLYMYDGAVSWENANFLVAAEYMAEHYGDKRHDDTHAYCAYVDYHKPFKAGIFNQWSVQGRFDGMTSQWDGITDSAEKAARNRITVGGTLTYKYKVVFADIRLNYEKYFYHSGADITKGANDKIVAELAIRF